MTTACQFQDAKIIIRLVGESSLELILARDTTGNSPLMATVGQKKTRISRALWNFIVEKSGSF